MTLFLLSLALSVLAGSLAWMAVILKRACCAVIGRVWSETLNGMAEQVR